MPETKSAPEAKRPLWAFAIATVLGLGHTPRMPGTVGAAVGLFLYIPAFLMASEWQFILPLAELALVLLLTALAVPRVLAAAEGVVDPPYVIIDEVAGMLCALSIASPDFVRILVAFVLFRILDIFKPFPVNRMESLPGTWGVLMDDVVAGLLAGLLSVLVLRLV